MTDLVLHYPPSSICLGRSVSEPYSLGNLDPLRRAELEASPDPDVHSAIQMATMVKKVMGVRGRALPEGVLRIALISRLDELQERYSRRPDVIAEVLGHTGSVELLPLAIGRGPEDANPDDYSDVAFEDSHACVLLEPGFVRRSSWFAYMIAEYEIPFCGLHASRFNASAQAFYAEHCEPRFHDFAYAEDGVLSSFETIELRYGWFAVKYNPVDLQHTARLGNSMLQAIDVQEIEEGIYTEPLSSEQLVMGEFFSTPDRTTVITGPGGSAVVGSTVGSIAVAPDGAFTFTPRGPVLLEKHGWLDYLEMPAHHLAGYVLTCDALVRAGAR